MFKAFFWGDHWKHRIRAWSGAAVLLLVLFAQVRIAVAFNAWNGTFFDTLTHATSRPSAELWSGLALLAWIALGDIVFGTVAGYGGSVYALWWRQALTEYYMPLWKQCSHRIEGASQRIQEDPSELAGIVEGIGMDFCRSLLTLFAFLPVLWALGSRLSFFGIDWPGTLALIALAASVASIGISWLVGAHLPKLEYDNQAAEAAFRKQLVFAEEQRSLIEAGRGWSPLFREVVSNYHRLFRHYGYFNGWSVSYDKFVMLLPYALCIPSLSDGTVTIALLMQIVNAFGEVQGGFSFVRKNWTRVTKFRSVSRRLREFELGLAATDVTNDPKIIWLPTLREFHDRNFERDLKGQF